MKEIARNIESRVFSSGAATTGTSAAARAMKSMQNFLTASSTAFAGTAGGLASPTAKRTVYQMVTASDTADELSVSVFNTVLEQVYYNGGNPEAVYVSPAVKRQISNFTATNQNRNIAAIEKKIVAALDFYYSDFGVIQVVMDRWVPQATNTVTTTAAADTSGQMFFIERAKCRLAWLRPVQHTLVGKRGDSVAGMVLGEVTLEMLNPSACIRISGVNNVTA